MRRQYRHTSRERIGKYIRTGEIGAIHILFAFLYGYFCLGSTVVTTMICSSHFPTLRPKCFISSIAPSASDGNGTRNTSVPNGMDLDV